MITKTTMKSLPYQTYVAVLLKDESRIDKANELGIDGYYIITKSPKMVIMFIEFIEAEYSKTHKKIWDMVKL